MRENALGYLLNRAGYHSRHVPHSWRATFATIMNEHHRHDRHVIDLILAHAPKDQTESAYNRALTWFDVASCYRNGLICCSQTPSSRSNCWADRVDGDRTATIGSIATLRQTALTTDLAGPRRAPFIAPCSTNFLLSTPYHPYHRSADHRWRAGDRGDPQPWPRW
jgi:hypothetical protein